jgi:hypothetical protein
MINNKNVQKIPLGALKKKLDKEEQRGVTTLYAREGLKQSPRKMEFVDGDRKRLFISGKSRDLIGLSEGTQVNEGKERGALLSKEFKVAVVIFEYNQNEKPIWYNKIADELEGIVSKTTIKKAIESLLDLEIIQFHYGETDSGRAGKLYSINPELTPLIGELWENFWNDTG